MDEVAVDACNKYSKLNNKVAPSLLLEFHGSGSSLEEQVSTVGEYLRQTFWSSLCQLVQSTTGVDVQDQRDQL